MDTGAQLELGSFALTHQVSCATVCWEPASPTTSGSYKSRTELIQRSLIVLSHSSESIVNNNKLSSPAMDERIKELSVEQSTAFQRPGSVETTAPSESNRV
jgi:hypothetical protein